MRKALSREELLAVYDERKEKMSPEEREQTLNKRLEKQIRYAYKNVSCREGDTGQCRGRTLRHQNGQGPREVADNHQGRSGGPAARPAALWRLPGSAHRQPGQDLRLAWARLQCVGPGAHPCATADLSPAGLSAGSAMWSWSPTSFHMVPAGLALTDVLDLMGCTVVPAGTGQPELQVKLLYELQPTALLGFPSFVDDRPGEGGGIRLRRPAGPQPQVRTAVEERGTSRL